MSVEGHAARTPLSRFPRRVFSSLIREAAFLSACLRETGRCGVSGERGARDGREPERCGNPVRSRERRLAQLRGPVRSCRTLHVSGGLEPADRQEHAAGDLCGHRRGAAACQGGGHVREDRRHGALPAQGKGSGWAPCFLSLPGWAESGLGEKGLLLNARHLFTFWNQLPGSGRRWPGKEAARGPL